MRALLFFVALLAHAQNYRVSGSLLNSESAAPIPNARMTLSAGSKTFKAVTSTDGAFSFDVPAGK